MSKFLCRSCGSNSFFDFADLGFSPPSNEYYDDETPKKVNFSPLVVKVCSKCFLAQTIDFFKEDEIFTKNYPYFSSSSQFFLQHARNFSEVITEELSLNHKSFVVEIASNDGYLLNNFKRKKIPHLGIEPTKSTAAVSRKKGIRTIEKFFSRKTATLVKKNFSKADLIIGNNVLAHVPNLNDFVSGLKYLLKDEGTITLEFPHLLNLIKFNQFDTVYHEHFSYFSIFSLKECLRKHGLRIYKINKINVHGGSLRIYLTHDKSSIKTLNSVNQIIKEERKFGLNKKATYVNFQKEINKIRDNFLSFLIKAKKQKKRVCGYGAAAKSAVLINYCGIRKDLIPFVCDVSKHKQNKFFTGNFIPIKSPSEILSFKPDYIVIFPWNLNKEISESLNQYKNIRAKKVNVIPRIKVF